MIVYLLPLLLGFLLDLIIGDPYNWPHPIRLIGKGIEVGEKITRAWFPKTVKGQLAGGTVMAIVLCMLSFAVPAAILYCVSLVNPWVAVVLETIMCYQILAIQSLKKESMKVYDELSKGDLSEAREKVSMIVGRDTQDLNEEQVAKAAIETVAENTSDGTVAPMLFMALGGAPLGFLYKAINTMDSMIGYKNDTYLYFGRFAAKLDDVANFIPARISAWIMILAAAILGMDAKNAIRIFKRDRFNHASPNSAQTEAVCAGALQIQLAGDAYYFGKRYEKKTIGDPIREIVYEDIAESNRLLYGTAVLCLFLSLGIRAAIYLLV